MCLSWGRDDAWDVAPTLDYEIASVHPSQGVQGRESWVEITW